jgi:hypothetical protein
MPEVAMQPSGTAHISWLDASGDVNSIQERSRLSTGTLGDIHWITTANRTTYGKDVAVDPAGNAVHAWWGADGSLSSVKLASGKFGFRPQVAVDPEGDAVVTWTYTPGPDPDVSSVQARRRSAAGTLGPLMTLSVPGCSCASPEVAVDSGGNAFVTWQHQAGPTALPAIHMRRLAADGTVGPLVTLSAAGSSALGPQVAIEGDDAVIFAWTRYDGERLVPQLKRRSAGGAYSPTQALFTSTGDATELKLAASAAGGAIAVWRDLATATIRARYRAAGGTLGSVLNLSGANAEGGHVAMDRSGNALVVWQRSDGTNQRIEGRRRAGGALSSVETFSPFGVNAYRAAADLDRAGNAVVAWEAYQPEGDPIIQARRRVPTGELSPVQDVSR